MSEKNLAFDPSLLFTPEGVKDIYGSNCKKREVICDRIQKEMSLYGFQSISTPGFEFFDIFNKERGTIPSNQMYKFFDQHNNTLVLRPDHTPQIARCYGRYFSDENMQVRLKYSGSTYIHRSGYQGKLSESMQIGAEIIGDSSSDVDGEMLTLTIECLKKCGLNSFMLDLGHAGIFKGLIEEAGLKDDETWKLRSYIENKNSHAVFRLLKDKDIPSGTRDVLIRLPEIFADDDSLTYIRNNVSNQTTIDAIDRLQTIIEILDGFNVSSHVTLDAGLMGRMGYYTGVIFKAYTYGSGEAVASGGRYDGLMSQFGKNAPAVGVVFMVDQLMDALESEKNDIPIGSEDVLILYRSANRSHAIELAHELRSEEIPVILMRKNAEISLEEYKKYALRNHIKEIRYIDDTGEITVFD